MTPRPVEWTEARVLRELTALRPDDPASAAEAVRLLGPLAPWWLDDPVLDSAAHELGWRPSLAESASRAARDGAMLPLFCWERPEMLHPGVLRKAFVLPVRWERGREADMRLPEGFRGPAERIRRQLHVPGFRLVLALEDPGADLRALPVRADSAWCLLAAGLLLAREGRAPRADVTASSTFSEGSGPGSVRGLEEKLCTAHALGCRLFYVSPADLARARAMEESAGAGKLEVDALAARAGLEEALEPLRVALAVPPGRASPLEERIEHYRRLRPVRDHDARIYYRETLLDDLLEDLEKRDRSRSGPYRGAALITMLSRNPEVALFVPRVIRPSACLVLCTEESRPDGVDPACTEVYRRIREICPEGGEPVRLSPPLHVAAAQAVRNFAVRFGDLPIVVDMTPGPRHVAFAAYGAAPPGQRVGVYVLQGWDEGSRRPGGEKLVWIPEEPAMPGGRASTRAAPSPPLGETGEEPNWTADAKILLEPLRPRLLRFDLVPRAQLRFGPNPGSIVRRTLGAALRNVACPEPEPCREQCRGNPKCLHALLFGVEPAPHGAGEKRRPFRPRPMVIRVRTGGARRVEKGVHFGIDMLLLGPLREEVENLLRGVEETGRLGLGRRRVPFEVMRASLVDAAGREIPVPRGAEAGSRGSSEDRPPTGPSPRPGTSRARVELRTRTRLVSRGSLATRVPFPLLIRAILRRYVAVRETWGDGRPDWNLGEIVRRSEEIGMIREDIRFADASRWSSRQGRRVPEGGILGTVDYAGPVAPFAGLLQAAEILHVGKGTLFGQGEIRVTFS